MADVQTSRGHPGSPHAPGRPRSPAGCVVLALLSLLALRATTHGQRVESDGVDPVAVAEAAEMLEYLGGPLDLPGHAPGERERREGESRDPPPPGTDTPAAAGAGEWFGGKPWWDWSRATGDWGGLRSQLERQGLTIDASYTFDLVGTWSGGRDRRPTSATLFDLNAALNLEKLVGLKGGTVFADFQVLSGDSPSRRVGDIQGTSNLESDQSRNQLSELWYEQWLLDDVLRLKIGKIDGNTEFDLIESAAEFLNSSAGMTVTGAYLPSYPDAATGVVVFVYPTRSWYIGLGFFDGASTSGIRTGERGPATFFSDDLSDDHFWTAETGITFDAGFVSDLRVALGVWCQEGEFAEYDGGTRSSATGMYIIAEGLLWSPNPDDEQDPRGLRASFRFGRSDEEIAEIGTSVGGGLHLTGTFPARIRDTAGVWINHADLSDAPVAGFARDETVIEMFYGMRVTPWITVTPDLQIVLDPSGSSEVGDAVVASLRVSITF